MIRKLIAGNYRSLGNRVEIPLDQMTVLVGHNAAGKSSIIDLLRFLHEAVTSGLANALTQRGGMQGIKRRESSEDSPVTVGAEFTFERGQATWEFSIVREGEADYRITREFVSWQPDKNKVLAEARATVKQRLNDTMLTVEHERWKAVEKALNAGDNKEALHHLQLDQFELEIAERRVQTTSPTLVLLWRANPELSSDTELTLPRIGLPAFRLIVQALARVGCYTIFPTQLRPPQKPDPARRPMDEHGNNWTSVLRRLKRETSGRELIAALHRVVGDITDYRVNQIAGYLAAEFRHGGDTWLDTTQESDGTLRLAGLLTALLQDPPLSVCCLEEPELTVHPGALPVLLDFLNETAKRTQVLLSTHSPELLDLVDVGKLLVVERRGSTMVGPIDPAQRELVRQHLLTTSDLLRAEGLRQAEQPPPTQTAPTD